MHDFVSRVLRPHTVYDGAQSVGEDDIHLYVLHGDSALLSHLQSCWWARLMVSMMQAYLLQVNACPAVVEHRCSSPPTKNPTTKT
jgi:hypothetical protein